MMIDKRSLGDQSLPDGEVVIRKNGGGPCEMVRRKKTEKV
jgi:hypothetical protein